MVHRKGYLFDHTTSIIYSNAIKLFALNLKHHICYALVLYLQLCAVHAIRKKIEILHPS